jgi:dTDP-4-amino-4,6-dideoxygalactose transaminase
MAGRNVTYVTQPLMPPLEDFIPYLQTIWDNKWLTNNGPFHQEFEIALAAHLGVEHIALVSNGTVALSLAAQALRLSGEVITTPFSFVATTHSLASETITPVFVDIDPVTCNLDPDAIERAITPRTTAIMAVHCYGHPCDVDRIREIAELYDLKVIYDAAHAFGVRHRGESLLRHGDLATLSFHATKVFNTFEGGAIVCPDSKTKQHIDRLKNFGYASELKVVASGGNYKMNEIQAAFGLLQLKHIDAAIEKRGRISAAYRSQLAGIAGITCLGDLPDVEANHAYFPILVGDEYPLSRDALHERLHAEGILARRYFCPLISDMPMYRTLPSAMLAMPVARRMAEQILCLPIYPDLPLESVTRTAAIIAT